MYQSGWHKWAMSSIGCVFLMLNQTVNAEPSLPSSSIVRDVAYGSDPAQRFDVYLPPNPRNAPVIFMVHGGAWKAGD